MKDVAEFASGQVASNLKKEVAKRRSLLYTAAGGYRIIGGRFKDGVRTITGTLPATFKSGGRARMWSPYYPYVYYIVTVPPHDNVPPPDKTSGVKIQVQEPTTLAAAKSSEEFIELLAACKGDTEESPDAASDTEQQQQKKCDVKYIVDSAGAADDGYTVLMALVSTHDDDWDDAVKALIDAGCDVNAKSKNGETALDIAAANDLPKTVAVLLEAGPNRRRPPTTPRLVKARKAAASTWNCARGWRWRLGVATDPPPPPPTHTHTHTTTPNTHPPPPHTHTAHHVSPAPQHGGEGECRG